MFATVVLLFFKRLMAVTVSSILAATVALVAVANLYFYLPDFMGSFDTPTPAILLFVGCFTVTLLYTTRGLRLSLQELIGYPVLSILVIWVFGGFGVSIAGLDNFLWTKYQLVPFYIASIVAVIATLVGSLFSPLPKSDK